MRLVKKISELRKLLAVERKKSKIIGFVPTMGYFHQGHLSLMERARKETDLVVVSSFVNPTQFGRGEDYQFYPRDDKGDYQKAKDAGVDYLFVPSAEEMYPDDHLAWVVVDKLSEPLCGRFRPGHFRGVATVVAKLFNVVEPNVAYFGNKDYQQLLVIKRMVKDLNFSLKVVGCPTVREDDGLAMSSRNSYLNLEERKAASLIPQALREVVKAFEGGERDSQNLIKTAQKRLHSPLIHLEYVEVCHPESLEELSFIEEKALFQMAVRIGKARLIDHIILGEKETYF